MQGTDKALEFRALAVKPRILTPTCVTTRSSTCGCMVMYTLNPSTLEAEAGGPSFQCFLDK